MKRVNGPRWARQAQRGDPTVSLMRMRWHALEPIDRAGLGGAQGQPILGGILEADEELFATSPRNLVQVLPALKFALVRELPHQLLLIAARSPHGNVGLGGDALA